MDPQTNSPQPIPAFETGPIALAAQAIAEVTEEVAALGMNASTAARTIEQLQAESRAFWDSYADRMAEAQERDDARRPTAEERKAERFDEDFARAGSLMAQGFNREAIGVLSRLNVQAGGKIPEVVAALREAQANVKAEQQAQRPSDWSGVKRAAVDPVGAAAQATGVSQFQQLTSSIGSFVNVLNPAVMFNFNLAVESVAATIGSALSPAMQVATEAVRLFAGSITPLMRQLADPIRTVAQAMLTVFRPVIDTVSATLQTLTPVLGLVADTARAMSITLSATLPTIGATVVTVAQALSGLVGGPIKSFGEMLVDAAKFVSKNFLIAAAAVAQFFGQTTWVDNLLRAIDPDENGMANRGTPNFAAAQAGGFSSVDSFARTVLTSAFVATDPGAAAPKDQTDYLRETVASIKEIRGDVEAAKREFNRQIDQAATTIANAVLTASGRLATNVLNDAAGPIKEFQERIDVFKPLRQALLGTSF